MDRRSFAEKALLGLFGTGAFAAGRQTDAAPKSLEEAGGRGGYIRGQETVVPTVESLKEQIPEEPQVVHVLGYHTPFDEGEGLFVGPDTPHPLRRRSYF